MHVSAQTLRNITLATLYLVCTGAGLILSSQVSAQEAAELSAATEVTLTAIPPRLGDDGSLLLKPGEKTQVQLQVKNTSARAVRIQSQISDFIIGDDGETPLPVSDAVSNRWSLASWMMIAPNSQTIGPNQTVGLTALIEVPSDALPGGHYAMITHEPTTETGESLVVQTQQTADPDSASAISQKVGTLVYLTVDGPINEEAYVRNFQFRNFSEYGPVPFSFLVENQSDIHIRPQIGIDIYNVFGQKVDSISLETKNVFPFMNRQFEGTWNRIWGWGYYRAQLTMSFGAQGSVVLANTNFWLIPLKLLLAVLITLLTVIAMGITIRRHMLHRASQSKERIEMLEKKLTDLQQDQLKRYED